MAKRKKKTGKLKKRANVKQKPTPDAPKIAAARPKKPKQPKPTPPKTAARQKKARTPQAKAAGKRKFHNQELKRDDSSPFYI